MAVLFIYYKMINLMPHYLINYKKILLIIITMLDYYNEDDEISNGSSLLVTLVIEFVVILFEKGVYIMIIFIFI